jgi:hypothetical protein
MKIFSTALLACAVQASLEQELNSNEPSLEDFMATFVANQLYSFDNEDLRSTTRMLQSDTAFEKRNEIVGSKGKSEEAQANHGPNDSDDGKRILNANNANENKGKSADARAS